MWLKAHAIAMSFFTVRQWRVVNVFPLNWDKRESSWMRNFKKSAQNSRLTSFFFINLTREPKLFLVILIAQILLNSEISSIIMLSYSPSLSLPEYWIVFTLNSGCNNIEWSCFQMKISDEGKCHFSRLVGLAKETIPSIVFPVDFFVHLERSQRIISKLPRNFF